MPSNDTPSTDTLNQSAQMIFGRIESDGQTDLQQLQVHAIDANGSIIDMATVDAQRHFVFRPVPTNHYRLRVVNQQGIDQPLGDGSQIDVFPEMERTELRLRLAIPSTNKLMVDSQSSITEGQQSFTDPLPVLLSQQQQEAENAELSLQQKSVSPSATAEEQSQVTTSESILLPEDQRPAAFIYLPMVTQNSGSAVQQADPAESALTQPDTITQPNSQTQAASIIPNTTYEVAAGDGQITGRVTDAVTGDGVKDGYVYAREVDFIDSGYGYPNASGYYTITDLLAGTYHVRFDPSFASEYI